MNLREAIEKRRSIHEFHSMEVDEAILIDIFQGAAWAPTHRMKEAWEIIVYQGEGRESYIQEVLQSYEREGFFQTYSLEKAEKMKQGIRKFLLSIPHHILIYMERDSDELKFREDYASVCAYIQNVQLLSWEKGVGVLWTTSPYLQDPDFVKGIGLDASTHTLAGVLQMGYPAGIPKAKPRSPIHKKMKIIKES